MSCGQPLGEALLWLGYSLLFGTGAVGGRMVVLLSWEGKAGIGWCSRGKSDGDRGFLRASFSIGWRLTPSSRA